MGETSTFKAGLNADLSNSRRLPPKVQGEGLSRGPTQVRNGLRSAVNIGTVLFHKNCWMGNLEAAVVARELRDGV